MKYALRSLLEGDLGSFKQSTLKGLANRGMISASNELTLVGWKQAVLLQPLELQCESLRITYETLNGLNYRVCPEFTAWQHFCALGYSGGYCEGGPILLLIRAAALDILSQLNTFGSRKDACSRFTEAQLVIHEAHSQNIINTIRHASTEQIVNNFKEIYNTTIESIYPDLTIESMLALFTTIGAEQLSIITQVIMEDPYQYRKGWPDLIMTDGAKMHWIEVKTTDKLHMSQITLFHRMKPLLSGDIRVCKLC